MNRIIRTALLATTISAIFASQAFAKDITVNIDGMRHKTVTTPYEEDNFILLSIRDLQALFGSGVTWLEGNNNIITAKDKGVELKFTIGSTTAYVNGEIKYLPIPVKKIEQDIFIPVNFVGKYLGADVNWNKETKVLSVSTGSDALSVINNAYIVTKDTTIIPYDEALVSVIRRNNSLSMLEDNKRLLEETQKNTEEDYKSALYANLDKAMLSLDRALHSLANSQNSIMHNQIIIKDSNEYLLRNYLMSIAVCQMDLQLLNESLSIDAKNITNVTLKQSLGLASDNEVKQATQKRDQNRANLATLQIELKNQRMALNNFMGLATDKDIFVQYVPQMKNITVDIGAYESSEVYASPSIKILENNVKNAEYELETSRITMDELRQNTRGESKLEKENNVNNAARELDDAKSAMKKNIRATYNKLNQLKEKQKTLDLDLQKAKDNYNTMVSNLQAGMVTQFEVDQVKLTILQAEIAIAKNIYNYDSLMFGFEHPYLLN